MNTLLSEERLHVVGGPMPDVRAAFAEDLALGLRSRPKQLSCRYFYDSEGSRLFERICELPEYYLTRAETEILARRSGELAGRFAERPDLVELGSGSAVKTRLLLEAFMRRFDDLTYRPIDVSGAAVVESARSLIANHERLEIAGVVAEYEEGLDALREVDGRPRLVLWLGSSIGNLLREDATAFLARLRERLLSADRLLVGIDLRKDKAVLEAAYDDAAGVTARFNKNLLARANRELGADFDLDGFAHRAVYREDEGRVELFLDSTRDQRATVAAVPFEVEFAEGEAVHTENSVKYSPAEVDALVAGAGFVEDARWFDDEGRFASVLMRP